MVWHLLRGTRLFPLLVACRNEISYRIWIAAGKPLPPPHLVKQLAVKELAKRYKARVFVESGTYFGDMVYAVREVFDEIYSIELDEVLCRNAQIRFAGLRNVRIVRGDSGDVLGEILSNVRQPCLFWLDGHYSGGITAVGARHTPIEKELMHISRHSFKRNHVILIDDARCFTGEGDYPSIQLLRDWAVKEGFDNFEVRDDMVRIHGAAAVEYCRI
jgi:hypothetical protein